MPTETAPSGLVPPAQPSADQTVGYLLHISETIGRVEGKLDTQNQVTRDLIVRVDAHDVRLTALEQGAVGHRQRIEHVEQTQATEAAAQHDALAASRATRRSVRLTLLGSGLMFLATAVWKLWDALGQHLWH